MYCIQLRNLKGHGCIPSSLQKNPLGTDSHVRSGRRHERDHKVGKLALLCFHPTNSTVCWFPDLNIPGGQTIRSGLSLCLCALQKSAHGRFLISRLSSHFFTRYIKASLVFCSVSSSGMFHPWIKIHIFWIFILCIFYIYVYTHFICTLQLNIVSLLIHLLLHSVLLFMLSEVARPEKSQVLVWQHKRGQ